MPHHEHDCDRCKYLGSFLDPAENCVMDAYLACDASSYDFIVRYGDLGDYITVGEASPYYRVCDALFKHYIKEELKCTS